MCAAANASHQWYVIVYGEPDDWDLELDGEMAAIRDMGFPAPVGRGGSRVLCLWLQPSRAAGDGPLKRAADLMSDGTGSDFRREQSGRAVICNTDKNVFAGGVVGALTRAPL